MLGRQVSMHWDLNLCCTPSNLMSQPTGTARICISMKKDCGSVLLPATISRFTEHHANAVYWFTGGRGQPQLPDHMARKECQPQACAVRQPCRCCASYRGNSQGELLIHCFKSAGSKTCCQARNSSPSATLNFAKLMAAANSHSRCMCINITCGLVKQRATALRCFPTLTVLLTLFG